MRWRDLQCHLTARRWCGAIRETSGIPGRSKKNDQAVRHPPAIAARASSESSGIALISSGVSRRKRGEEFPEPRRAIMRSLRLSWIEAVAIGQDDSTNYSAVSSFDYIRPFVVAEFDTSNF